MLFKYPKKSNLLFSVRSGSLGQHLPKVKDSKQEGPLSFMTGRFKSNINIWRRTQKNSKNCLNYTDFITKSIEEALLLGVVQETSKEYIHNLSPLNVNVKNNNGKPRLIFNVMFINQFMVVSTFKYPQLHKEGGEIFGNSSWAYGIDISQAFYHIEIDPNYRKYLGFSWNGKYYIFVCIRVPCW